MKSLIFSLVGLLVLGFVTSADAANCHRGCNNVQQVVFVPQRVVTVQNVVVPQQRVVLQEYAEVPQFIVQNQHFGNVVFQDVIVQRQVANVQKVIVNNRAQQVVVKNNGANVIVNVNNRRGFFR